MRKWTYKCKINLRIPVGNTAEYEDQNIKSLGPHIWNALSEKVKAEHIYQNFRNFINSWFGPSCKWNLCLLSEANNN